MISEPLPILESIALFRLKWNMSEPTADRILQYLKDFGTGTSAIEHANGEVILHIYHQRDLDLMRSEFSEFTSWWAETDW
jgi:hypothetical protein